MTNQVTRILIDDIQPVEKTVVDPFSVKVEDLRHFDGLNNNFKRRKLTKAAPVSEAVGSKQLYPENQFSMAYSIFDAVIPPYNLDELASFFDNSPTNHAAINAKVSSIVGLGYELNIADEIRQDFEELEGERLKRAQRKAERNKTELKRWLEDLNEEDTFIHTLEKVYTDLEATGNGYIEIGRTTNGQIGYLGHIPSISIRIRRQRDGYIQLVGNKVVYFRPFGSTKQNGITNDPRPNEILHIKKYSPRNSYYGVPDTVAAAVPIVGNDLAGKFNVDFFENKATPRYIATLKGATLSQESEEKFFRFLQSGLKGQNHRTLFIPLPPDTEDSKVEFKMEAVESGILEASFLDYRKENVNEVLMAHGVPISRVGGTSSQNIAAALAADRTFKESVARPAQDRLEKVVNRIIQEKTKDFIFQLKEISLTEEKAQAEIDQIYLRNKVITPNEVRPRLGLPMMNTPEADKVIELKPDQAAEARAQAGETRQRDQQRSANNSDSTSTTDGRNPKGEGRKQP